VAASCLYAVIPHDTHANSSTTDQSTPIIPRQVLFGNPEKASLRISPKGDRLAFLAPNEQNVLNVWVSDLDMQNVKQVTRDENQGIRRFSWQLDGAHILYAQDKDGNEDTHLYQTDLHTLETKNLTPYEGVKVGIVASEPQFPDEVLIQMNRRDPTLFDVYRLNLQTGELTLDTENPGGVVDWVADHQLQIRASLSYTPDGSSLIRLRMGADKPWYDFMTVDPLDNANIVGFSPDGESVYLLTDVNTNTSRLLKIDLETMNEELILVDPDYDLASLMTNPQSAKLEAVGIEREKFEWIVLDPDLKKDFDYLANTLKTSFSIASRDLQDRLWIVASHSDQKPTHYHLYHRSSPQLDFLFSTQPKLEQFSLSPMNPITYSARDGMKLHGYLTLPLEVDPHNLPSVLLVHGGPWSRDSWGLDGLVQWLANRGYAVMQINFRGSTGYGKEHVNAGNKEWSKKMHLDLLDGKEWLVSQGIADPDKVAIYGGSYGGYATLVGLSYTPDEFCCGVDIVGPSNLITLLNTLPPYWNPLKASMDRRIGSLEEDEEFLKACSPLFKCNHIRKPLLIGQGANDPRVKQAESDQIVAAMRQNNLPVQYLLFEDEGHGFAKPQNRLKFFAAAEKFLAQYLGGRCEPPSENENWEALMK
jgi:dipeptidyl aminopeptidase/acylaminoacyl peptidase